jgi:hypothetical protein
MSTRRRRPRSNAANTFPADTRFRIVIHAINDEGARLLTDYTVEGYVAVVGRRLPNHQFEHNTLRAGPLDLTLDLASVIPDAMVGFIDKHLRPR